MNQFIPSLIPVKTALLAFVFLYGSVRCAAQVGDSIKNIPTNIRTAGQNKVVSKSNSVTSDALTLADSTSNKVFRGMKGMFKKKPHPPAAAAPPSSTTTTSTTTPATTTTPAPAPPPATAPKDSTTGHPAATSMNLQTNTH